MRRSRWARRAAVGVAVAGVGLIVTACTGSSDAPDRAPSTAAVEGYPYETSDEGDDLLSDDVRTSDFGGAVPRLSWRFPTFYTWGSRSETSTTFQGDGVLHTIEIVAEAGTTPREQAQALADELEAGDEAIHDVRLGGRDWTAVVVGDDDATHVTLLGTLPGGIVTGAGFTADAPPADVPADRIAELHQTLLSIRPDAAAAG